MKLQPAKVRSTTAPQGKPLPCGTPMFVLQRVTTTKLEFLAETICILCGEPVIVRYGNVAATFKIGNEFLGLCCDDCLSAESRDRLQQMRGTAVTR